MQSQLTVANCDLVTGADAELRGVLLAHLETVVTVEALRLGVAEGGGVGGRVLVPARDNSETLAGRG